MLEHALPLCVRERERFITQYHSAGSFYQRQTSVKCLIFSKQRCILFLWSGKQQDCIKGYPTPKLKKVKQRNLTFKLKLQEFNILIKNNILQIKIELSRSTYPPKP